MSIYFKSRNHRDRFLSAIGATDKVYDVNKVDQEYGAALYILSADAGLYEDVQPYISRRGIQFDEIVKEIDLSSGYLVLVKLAGNLFNSSFKDCEDGTPVTPIDFSILDEQNFQVALTALIIRRSPIRLSDLSGATV